MIVTLYFKNDLSAADLNYLIFNADGSHSIDVPTNVAEIQRDDIIVGKAGGYTWVEIQNVPDEGLSDTSKGSIRKIIPTKHIKTEISD